LAKQYFGYGFCDSFLLTQVKVYMARAGMVTRKLTRKRLSIRERKRGALHMLATILTVPSLLVLAAHSLRLGSIGGVIFWLGVIILTFAPLSWKNWALAGLLAFGAWLYADITLGLIGLRLELDLPWLRLLILLSGVILLHLAAAVVHWRRALRDSTSTDLLQALAFLLTVAGLALARQQTAIDIILTDRFIPGSGWLVIFLLGCYSAWITAKLLDRHNQARWRRILWTVFSGVFFTQLLLGLLGLERFMMSGTLHLPIPALIAAGPLYRGDGFFMIILFAVTILLVGPAWCSYLCYFGVWDSWAAGRRRYPGSLPHWSKKARWSICLLVLGAAVLLGWSGLPVSLAIIIAACFGLGGVAVMLFWSRRHGAMTHCVVYCPMGLIADIFGKINPWRIRIDRECTQCGKCSRYCRYGALTSQDITRGRAGISCTLCGDCLCGCSHEQLYYYFPGLSRDKAREIFILAVVVLHAVFLGVARL
jgi:ferredoxin